MEVHPREGKETGPGRIQQRIKDGRFIIENYLLYNYNIDGNQLKPEHKLAIHKYILPTLIRGKTHVVIFGTASSSGEREYNQKLSESRVLVAKQYLQQYGFNEAQIPGNQMRAYGEDLNRVGGTENEKHRSIVIQLRHGLKRGQIPVQCEPLVITPEPPKPAPTPPTPKPAVPTPRADPLESNDWSMRYMGGKALGVGYESLGGQMTSHEFLLRNNRTGQYSFCEFTGNGAVGSVPSPIPVSGSITTESFEWKHFKTPSKVKHSDFSGSARWFEGFHWYFGGFDHKVHFNKIGKQVAIETGATVGVTTPGSSTNHGIIKCSSPFTYHGY